MKKPVMKREMFIAVAPKSGSKGIMSGFDDEMEIEDYEDRTPENLEIIANNLRGDIRSMDERYLELAQMVGESAFETPEEVIALMQSQMGQQQPPQVQPLLRPNNLAALLLWEVQLLLRLRKESCKALQNPRTKVQWNNLQSKWLTVE
jgi:hypothetical protein